MHVSGHHDQGEFQAGDIGRITRIGKYLRKSKLDELPELFNVVNGEMSIIGPRPEVQTYVRAYPGEFDDILKVRPGLTDYASIKYRNEQEILAVQPNPENYYLHVILPDKLKLAKRYVEEISLSKDLWIIGKTIKIILGYQQDEPEMYRG